MWRYTLTLLITVFSQSLWTSDSGALQTTTDPLSDRLRARIQAESIKKKFVCQGELICGASLIPRFYANREFKPAWWGPAGILSQANSLLEAIRDSGRDGLSPGDYHLSRLSGLMAEIKDKQANNIPVDTAVLVDLDLLLTDAFLLLASHLLAGRVNPETIHAEWVVFNPQTDLAAALQSALETNQVKSVLNTLRPSHAGYQALREKLQHYRTISRQGGWPVLPTDTSWQKGDHGTRFLLLRKRLELSGDVDLSKSGRTYIFDEALEKAIRRFKKRMGLPHDGVIDQQTLLALNIPVEERIRQIELNLERWRWLPHELGQRHILVNIADFTLSMVEGSDAAMKMRVVVGKDYQKTPVFSKNMTYLVLNPYWNIPRKIAVEDILPKVKRNPRYLLRKKIKVFESWKKDAAELDPLGIDWSQVTQNNFSFKLRREPGPRNDLGQIKFMLPNKFAVYLHDTPFRGLFRKSARGFSHGCIRLEHALDLATYLLRDDPDWTREKIVAAIRSSERQAVRLGHPIPVHILYWTAWVSEAGLLHFRDDIYERDKPLDVALRERPPKV